ncbi:MAG: hypothetical protein KME35_06665 [Aphanocapsa sp. GSE-SYN-MK-11-07L]|jgi:hypothetical protein|nr:hypothetical protein [Aphanocapsa sp. GSE-SYN-MK-11-07L]
MARRIDPTCLACSRLPQAQAIAHHSPGGEGRSCWNHKRCPRKRSHYRHRAVTLAKRRGEYRATHDFPAITATETIAIPLKTPPAAFVCLYKGKAKDAPLHALAVMVVQADQIIAQIEPQHFMRLKNRQVNEYLQQVLGVLGDRFGITEFERQVIRLEPEECPILNCPLTHPPSFSLS